MMDFGQQFMIEGTFHFFTAEAILFLNFANGLATPMRLKHRRFAHGLLQICGFICIVLGTLFVISEFELSGAPHGIIGLVSAALALCSCLSSIFAVFGKGDIKLIHIVIGLPTFLLSSISLCLGFLETEFEIWAGKSVVYTLISFVTFYTLIIIIKVLMKLL
ncbi:uncharacterized protein LOC106135664 [Amyelois transitella]|uniref:uncharacterized protein LOC106135664 n=1 Tax=Amyelois transitella TaxID=680683 RepID=UPI00298F7FFC|nr:uncharacterized protein LOC106135664 [Amyelois transitella]